MKTLLLYKRCTWWISAICNCISFQHFPSRSFFPTEGMCQACAAGFVRPPSTNYRMDTLKRHDMTAIHKAAEEKEKCIREGSTYTNALLYKLQVKIK